MRALLYFFVFLITYGSLYPFNFDFDSYHRPLLASLFDFSLGNTGRGDLVANLLLFIPFGFLAVRGYPGGNRVGRMILVLLVGFALAYLIQAVQLIIPGRTPSGSDAVWNLLGCGIGCALAWLPLPRFLYTVVPSGELPSIPLVLALLWLAYNWAPFVPSIDLQLLKDNLKMIASSSPDLFWVLQKIVMWLVIFHFLQGAGGLWTKQRYYPWIIMTVLVGSLFIVGHRTTIEHVAGGVLAIPAWYLVRNRRRPPLLAILVAFSVVATTFTPFDLRSSPTTFQWIPFTGALGGNMLINVMAILSKLIVYGSLIWLLVEAGFRLRTASLAVAAGLLLSEQLQVFFRGPTPEITDPLLALVIGITFHAYENARVARLRLQGIGPVGQIPGKMPREDMSCEEMPPKRPAQREGAARRDRNTIQLNLHRYQAAFVRDAAMALGCSRHQLCAGLLALERGDPDSAAMLTPLKHIELGREVMLRDQSWVALSIALDAEASATLKALAARGRHSKSYTLRHLIDAHILRLSTS